LEYVLESIRFSTAINIPHFNVATLCVSLGSPLLKSVIFSFVHSHLKYRPTCYSNHHTDKPHNLPRQVHYEESSLTAQLASTTQIKRKC